VLLACLSLKLNILPTGCVLAADGGPGPHLHDELRVQVQAVRAEPAQAQGQASRPLSGIAASSVFVLANRNLAVPTRVIAVPT
jgi:hypothetical protein